MSTGLRELCLYYCNRLSFSEVAKLVERVAGGEQRLICQQRRFGTGLRRRLWR